MEPSDSCPEPGTWKTFLDGELLDEASADLTAHLEECEACQQTLERLAAGKETWEGTARQLAEADAKAEQLESSGHLRDVLNDLKTTSNRAYDPSLRPQQSSKSSCCFE
mgnify:CR=1 FL=1